MPEVEGGEYLISALFDVGPSTADGPLDWQTLESWTRMRGITLRPWEAQLLVNLGRAHFQALHEAKAMNAEPPLQEAKAMWRWVKNWKGERSLDKVEKESDSGNRKRR
jgi:hypothetical protein